MTSSPRRGSVRERVEAKLGPPTATGCREWQLGDRNSSGYRSFRIDGRRVKIHRAVWELHHGPIPDGLNVLHTCDNPPCGEITHLWLGTLADNNADRAAKGRSDPQYGERSHGIVKLTEDRVREIRHRRELGETLASLGQRFGLAASYVSRIARRKAWAHVC